MFEVLENENVILKLSLNYRNNYYYKAYDKENNYIGNCGIRLEDTYDNYYLGNIEYEVFEEFRGHNYSLDFSKLLLRIANYCGKDVLSITANPMNIASRKTIESLGAKFVEVIEVPKKSILYKQGNRKVNRYIINTKGRNL